jgi:hypothetical protein
LPGVITVAFVGAVIVLAALRLITGGNGVVVMPLADPTIHDTHPDVKGELK